MKVFCIIGDERALRLKSSPMFTAVMNRIGIKGVYVPFQVAPEHIGPAVQSLRILNIAGANVTVPYKETAIPFMDVLSEGARFIGAINTIVRKGDQLKGYNTNAIGFMEALNFAGYSVAGKSALVFGTGGAAKAVIFILNWLQAAAVTVVSRDKEKSMRITARMGGEAIELSDLTAQPNPANLIVNATSVSSPEESPEFAALAETLKAPACELVMDLNYGRPQNFWQAMAAKNNIPFMDGLPALAHQARRSFSLWTGIQVPPDEFLKAL